MKNGVSPHPSTSVISLEQAVDLSVEKLLTLAPQVIAERSTGVSPVLVVLAAGKGTRFGSEPKCVQPVGGLPLARHSVNAFRQVAGELVIGLVHYRHQDVMRALGDDLCYVRSDNPTGGTAFAAFEAFAVPGLAECNPLLILTMGDRIVPESTFRRLLQVHGAGEHEACLTLLSARYQAPRQVGKGRIVRDASGRILRIIEQRDIDVLTDPVQRRLLHDATEANCPLYAIRARTLHRYLGALRNDNAQGQYYITDIVAAIARDGGEIRSITSSPADPEYDLLCADVTRPRDLALLEGVLQSVQPLAMRERSEVAQAAARITEGRPTGQVGAIAAQLREMLSAAQQDRQGFADDQPVALGLSGGRLRIAFMHPDMGRFYGPAWQMPTGARDAQGREQILVLLQTTDDNAIHLFPSDAAFREKLNAVPADSDFMYPGDEINDWYSYEGFGTRMAEHLLMSLGYFSDRELQTRRELGLPLPPAALWVSNGMRRPFALIGNAIASIRTLRDGTLGAQVQSVLGRESFRGLRVATSGNIPCGGFSSSSAVTVAVKNAVNALFDLGIPPDLLVHLACQAEYGTGVRAGTLDQATAQKGKAGQGAVISSNPRDSYGVLGVFPVPSARFTMVFPYTVDRDREAWQWSGGCYGATAEAPQPTTGEIRKLTGKAAEMAALLTRLPLEEDWFPWVQDDLLRNGRLSAPVARKVADTLRAIPLRISRETLHDRLRANRDWLGAQLVETRSLSRAEAQAQADATIATLAAGWRDPLLRRPGPGAEPVFEIGVPLRAMVAYLFGEVAKNFYLMHHPESWIASVSASQAGDRCFAIDPEALPPAAELLGELPWEQGVRGPARLDRWLAETQARPVDFNQGLEDEALAGNPPPLHQWQGGNFFRGLALIDLAEAMLRRAFGVDAVAVRVNAAGQGDYFQVHIDTHKAEVAVVEHFLCEAFYRRFDVDPEPRFVRPHPGGGAVGVRLSRFDRLSALIQALEKG